MAKVYEYIPSAHKAGATAAIIPNREEASVTRTSDGYSENADGTLELKGANETRYYYDNGVRKILIEDSATNLLSYTESFDNRGGLRIIEQSNEPTIDPSKNFEIFRQGNSTKTYFSLPNTSVVEGLSYTISMFVKAGDVDKTQIACNSRVGDATVNFDLTNKSFSILKNCTATMEEFPNGIFRISCTVVADDRTFPLSANISLIDNSSVRNPIFTGDNGDFMYVWGLNLVQSDTLTSYIPNLTTGTSTRTADTLNDNTSLTLSRTSQAYRTNKDGVLELMDANVPRIDYSDDLNCPSLLLEPQATNNVSDFNTWGSSDNAVILNEGSSSINSDSTQYLVDLSDNSSSRIFFDTRGVSDLSTFSVYMKKHENDTNGTFPIAYGNGGVSYLKQYFTLTDEWQRFQVYKGNSSIFVALTRAGDTSLETLTRAYVTMPQYEEGTKATSYIPNSFSNGTSTRTADTNVQTGDISQYLNQSEGVLEANVKYSSFLTDNRIMLIGDGNYNIRFWANDTTSNTSSFRDFIGFPDVGGYGGNIAYNVELNTDYNIKIVWKSGTNGFVKIKVNEQELKNYNLNFSEPVFQEITTHSGGNQFEGSIKSIKIYDSINDY